MSRPLKLTPKVHEAIVKSIRGGNYVYTACAAAGVDQRTYNRWLERADHETETDSRFVRFADAIARAEADAENDAVQALAAHQHDDWRAAEAYLKRRFPSRWSEKVVQEQTGPGGGPQKVEVSLSDDDARAAYHALIDAGLVQPGPAALADPEA